MANPVSNGHPRGRRLRNLALGGALAAAALAFYALTFWRFGSPP